MGFTAHLIAIALRLQGTPPGAEAVDDYRFRLDQIVTALVDASERYRELAVASLVLMDQESRFRREVHSGAVLGPGPAICLGQFEEGPHLGHKEWLALAGLDRAATERCVGRVVSTLRRYRGWCGSWAGAFSAYATGKGCKVIPLGQHRANLLNKLLRTW